MIHPDNISGNDHEDIHHRNTLIIGGSKTTNGAYPFMVLLSDEPDKVNCGGSLIAPYIVLSAAHCQGSRYIFVGRYDLSNETEGYEMIEIEEEIIHPSYNDATFDYDYMVIKLKNSNSTIASSSFISLDNGTFSSKYQTGDELKLLGWGNTLLNNSNSISNVLLETDLPYLSREECNDAIAENTEAGSAPPLPISDHMFCTNDPNQQRAFCSGDSGGPLFEITEEYGPVQVGIVSWSGFICLEGGPDVFANVSNQIEWINQKIHAWTTINMVEEGLSLLNTANVTDDISSGNITNDFNDDSLRNISDSSDSTSLLSSRTPIYSYLLYMLPIFLS